jgi:excisionase family DNA binding protein
VREDQLRGLFLPKHLRSLGQALTVTQVAELLQVSERHVYHLVQSGVMPHFKIGSAVRFDPDTLGDWLQKIMDGNGMAIFSEKKLLKGKKEPGLLGDGRKE